MTCSIRCASAPTRTAFRLAALVLAAALSAYAGSISTLSTSFYVDNKELPGPRSAENGSIPIDLSGDWFSSGACELLVDGVVVASSSGALQTYTLAADPTTWHSYRLTLRSDGGETTKVVTVFPYAGFICAMHRLDLLGGRLDARPAGTIRHIISGESMPVTWSAIWNDDATAPVVALRRGNGLDGASLGTLATGDADAEGDFLFSPKSVRLIPGLYTLTHFDGIETLTSVIDVRNRALFFTLR